MTPDPETQELKIQQSERERSEQDLAASSPVQSEAAQHERRAEKAEYLREKLEERERSEREAEAEAEEED